MKITGKLRDREFQGYLRELLRWWDKHQDLKSTGQEWKYRNHSECSGQLLPGQPG